MTGLRSLMSNVSAMVGDQGAQLDTTERYVEHADVLVDEGVHELQYVRPRLPVARLPVLGVRLPVVGP